MLLGLESGQEDTYLAEALKNKYILEAMRAISQKSGPVTLPV